MTDAAPTTLPDELLTILRCPLTRSTLSQEGDWLVAAEPEGSGLRYPIRDGIPVLLVDEAALPEGVDSLAAFKERYAGVIPG